MGSIGRQASRQRSQKGNQVASRTIGILGNNLRSLQDLWVPHKDKRVGKGVRQEARRPQGPYSHLSNNRGGWNKRGGEAKIAKSLNVEAGINVEVGKYL